MLAVSNVAPSFKNTNAVRYPSRQYDPRLQQQVLMQQEANKKDKWQKAGVIAQIGLAAAFVTMAITSLLNHKANKAMLKAQAEYFSSHKKDNELKITEDVIKKFKEEFVDLSKNKGIVDITDESLPKSFRDWAKDIVEGAQTPKAINEFFGTEATPNMIYMYGGSGVGKTYNADVLLKALGAERIKRQFSSYSSKYIGETSVNITTFFNQIEKMLQENPNKKIGIVLDEFETLAHSIEKLGEHQTHLKENRTALLNGIDQIRKYPNVYIVASSNVPLETGQIDKAIARRFGKNLEIEYPTVKALLASLKTQLKNCKGVKNGSYDFFAQQEREINEFLETMHRRKGGHGDVETIVKEAINKARIETKERAITEGAIDKTGKILDQAKLDKVLKETKFDIKYLKEALAGIGKLAGETPGAY